MFVKIEFPYLLDPHVIEQRYGAVLAWAYAGRVSWLERAGEWLNPPADECPQCRHRWHPVGEVCGHTTPWMVGGGQDRCECTGEVQP